MALFKSLLTPVFFLSLISCASSQTQEQVASLSEEHLVEDVTDLGDGTASLGSPSDHTLATHSKKAEQKPKAKNQKRSFQKNKTVGHKLDGQTQKASPQVLGKLEPVKTEQLASMGSTVDKASIPKPLLYLGMLFTVLSVGWMAFKNRSRFTKKA